MGVTKNVAPTFLFGVPPCGASYFAHGGKVGKTPPGIASGEHLPTVVLTVSLSPDPFYESGALRSGSYFRRAKSRSVPLLLSAHWGLLPSKFDGIATLTYTACCVPTCLVRQWSGGERRVPEYGPAATAFLHQAVPFQRYFFQSLNM